ncbi:MAG: glycosyltransferase family 2 protein [Candidatus Omnitrophota bacterium]
MSPDPSRPFFSVVIPVYNGENFLSAAIDSVLAQPFRDWELVVVDDMSQDKTPTILARYAAAHPNIRPVRNEENLGIAKSLNRGIRESRGEWIVRLDCDDLFARDYLETLRGFIETLPHGYCFVSCWVTVISGKGNTVLDIRLPPASTITRMMQYENFLYHSATSFPRRVWEQVGGYPDEDRKLSEDTEMWKRFIRFGVSLIMLPRFLVYYRIHDANYTSFKDTGCLEHGGSKGLLMRQYHTWRLSLFLKQGELRAARDEIQRLRKILGKFSLKTLYYHLLTYLPKPIVHNFMWEIRPRLRRLAKGFS